MNDLDFILFLIRTLNLNIHNFVESHFFQMPNVYSLVLCDRSGNIILFIISFPNTFKNKMVLTIVISTCKLIKSVFFLLHFLKVELEKIYHLHFLIDVKKLRKLPSLIYCDLSSIYNILNRHT